MENEKITKISEIKKVIKCSCGRGEMKLKMLYVCPNNGKVGLSYSRCSYSFCSYDRGVIKITDIIINDLIIN